MYSIALQRILLNYFRLLREIIESRMTKGIRTLTVSSRTSPMSSYLLKIYHKWVVNKYKLRMEAF